VILTLTIIKDMASNRDIFVFQMISWSSWINLDCMDRMDQGQASEQNGTAQQYSNNTMTAAVA